MTFAELLDGIYRQRLNGDYVLTFRNGVPVRFGKVGLGHPLDEENREKPVEKDRVSVGG